MRPAKVSWGVDYLTAVRQVYESQAEKVLSEDISIASKKLKWIGIEDRRYYARFQNLLLSVRNEQRVTVWWSGCRGLAQRQPGSGQREKTIQFVFEDV